MRPFRFQLESVRALSEHAEAAARLELAGELTAGLAREPELDEATALLEDARPASPLADGVRGQRLGHAGDGRVPPAPRGVRVAAAEALILQERRIEAQRDLLVEASRRRQTLEKLKLRRKAAHRAELERPSSPQLNEVSLLLHDRRVRDAR